jgi:hypothetical protein
MLRHVQQRTWNDARQTERRRSRDRGLGLKSVVSASVACGCGGTVSIGGLATGRPALLGNGLPEREPTQLVPTGQRRAVLLDPAPVARIESKSTATPPTRHGTASGTGYCGNYSDVLCSRSQEVNHASAT